VVACANVAGLLLQRRALAPSRNRRAPLAGGTRTAILRSLLGEHLVLAIAAAAGGVLVAQWMIPSLVALAPPGLVGDPAYRPRQPDCRWSIAAAVLTTLLAGLIPSAAISSAKPGDALNSAPARPRAAAAGRQTGLVRSRPQFSVRRSCCWWVRDCFAETRCCGWGERAAGVQSGTAIAGIRTGTGTAGAGELQR
jgi:hypothetical protein